MSYKRNPISTGNTLSCCLRSKHAKDAIMYEDVFIRNPKSVASKQECAININEAVSNPLTNDDILIVVIDIIVVIITHNIEFEILFLRKDFLIFLENRFPGYYNG